MIRATETDLDVVTFADAWEQLGKVPLSRIRMRPAPGTATEADVVAVRESPSRRICELFDGVLVEKAMGAAESFLALHIARLLLNFLDRQDLGIALGEAGQLRLWPGRVRVPDVCFISWDRMPKNEVPDDPLPDLVPDLAIEVLSRSNTKKEMARKRLDYFQAGVQEVWEIQPKTQTAEVYTSPTKHRRIETDGTLEGGDILPGFTVSLTELFGRLKKKKK